MTTNRIIALVLIALGIVLIYMGYQSSQGLDDQLSEAVTGNFTDETMFYWLGGAIAVIAGVVMLRR
jgi:drug/metabolite transporter (DMT)-like permease